MHQGGGEEKKGGEGGPQGPQGLPNCLLKKLLTKPWMESLGSTKSNTKFEEILEVTRANNKDKIGLFIKDEESFNKYQPLYCELMSKREMFRMAKLTNAPQLEDFVHQNATISQIKSQHYPHISENKYARAVYSRISISRNIATHLTMPYIPKEQINNLMKTIANKIEVFLFLCFFLLFLLFY